MEHLEQLNRLSGIERIEVKQFLSEKRNRPDFDNKWMKLFFFIFREGLFITLRKAFAHRLPQRNYLTVLKATIDGNSYLNISVQFQTNPEEFVLKNEFIPYFEINYREIEKKTDEYLPCFNQFTDESDYEKLGGKSVDKISLGVMENPVKVRYHNGLFVYGLGGYVQMFIMHHFKKIRKIACVDLNAELAKQFEKKFHFTTHFLLPHHSYNALKQVEDPYVIIATYHSSHASIAREVYEANPNATIFIEKPPAVTLDDLQKLITLFNRGAKLEFGFNRRFIGYSNYVRKQVDGKVLVVTCSVKEVLINPNHWYFWKNQGTRVTGNAVHWFDLANYWIRSKPVEINVMAPPEDKESPLISVCYENGSVLNITASDKGNSLRGVQEKIEIRYENETIFINDFTSLIHIKKNGTIKRKFRFIRSKGHDAMYKNFKKIIMQNRQSEYTLFDLICTSVVTYYASEMLKNGIRSQSIKQIITQYIKSI
ncbi:MAG: Gfo/Idh/MocA family oxidoreductase [Bacteroidales bacterium]|jgi:predicted dehydrogenase